MSDARRARCATEHALSVADTLHLRQITPRFIARALARLQAMRADTGHASLAKRVAGTTFLIRVGSAALAYLSQIALARWMGTHEFGIYVYVWTWALLIGNIADAGLAFSAQKFVPEYSGRGAFDGLRGFIFGSRLLTMAMATVLAGIAALAVMFSAPLFEHAYLIPLYLGCLCLPIYALSSVQDGIARCYNWTSVGQMPTFILRPILLLAMMAAAYCLGYATNATTAILCSVASFWMIGIAQTVLLNRNLAVAVPQGPRTYEPRIWLSASLPIAMAVGFYVMLTYVDVIALQFFRPPEDVAHYHAASKTLTLVSFVYFSVTAATAHRFSAYHVAGERAALEMFLAQAIRWTFWPSLGMVVAVLAVGQPLLVLFGPDFVAAYPLMFVLALGLLARASVGPAERLLSMLGEQRACAIAYAIAFATNLIACVLLIPRYGALGAAMATSIALFVESAQLFWINRKRLGLHTFVFRRA
jgi:O-antigen/teichoic acid export membrane protein